MPLLALFLGVHYSPCVLAVFLSVSHGGLLQCLLRVQQVGRVCYVGRWSASPSDAISALRWTDSFGTCRSQKAQQQNRIIENP